MAKAKKAAKKAKAPAKCSALAHGFQWVNPYLCVKDPAAAIAFYEKAFGFRCRFKMDQPDGKIGHAELQHKDGVIMVGPECPDIRTSAPSTLNGTPVSLYVYVDRVDKTVESARAAGAIIAQEPQDMFWGDRIATVVDPEGHRWCFATHVRDVTPAQLAKAMKECAEQPQEAAHP
jgi:uncharacterized glyoxalase superfamily protein PhnB